MPWDVIVRIILSGTGLLVALGILLIIGLVMLFGKGKKLKVWFWVLLVISIVLFVFFAIDLFGLFDWFIDLFNWISFS